MSFKTVWPPPYPDLNKRPEKEIRRLTIKTCAHDCDLIASVAVSPTIFSLICQTALKLTAEYVRANNLTYTDSERFIQYIRERTFALPVDKTPPSMLAGRVEKIRRGAANAKDKSAKSRQGTSSERSGESGTGGSVSVEAAG